MLANGQTSPVKVYPVEKTPQRRLYCYMKQICSECGYIHLYRKVQTGDAVLYGCTPNYQTGLLPEDRTYQPRLLDLG